MQYSPELERYLQGFAHADRPWPPPALSNTAELNWWSALAWHDQPHLAWEQLCIALPQLRLPQRDGISRSDLYRQVVLQGALPTHPELVLPKEVLAEPEALTLVIAQHTYLAMPVLSTPNAQDFLYLTRALAHRAEPVHLEPGVHAQAISGLIHWDLIRSLGPQHRARVILLHEAPYGSLSHRGLPFPMEQEAWIKASTAWRLEHELTHLTTKLLLGEMRLNLLDELIADVMGQLIAFGHFSAELFCLCLQQRWRAYTRELSAQDAYMAFALVKERASELGNARLRWNRRAEDRQRLLPWLCQLRLDQPITTAQPQLLRNPG